MQPEQISVDNLYLDHQNPRTGITSTQSEALRELIDLSATNFETLMESIREHGLDPGDAFYVIEDVTSPGDFIVVDGNRRLAALRVLKEPNLVLGLGVSDSYREKLARIASGFSAKDFAEVRCVVFPERSIADEWILRRLGRGMDPLGYAHDPAFPEGSDSSRCHRLC